METKVEREIIKSEIRAYARMLKDLDVAMYNKTTISELKEIAAHYGVPGNVLKMLVDTQIIIGITDDLVAYELQYEQEYTKFNFCFTEEISYKMADAIRMWRIYQKHIRHYYKYEQAIVFAELHEEDSKMNPRCVHCGDVMFSFPVGKKYCSSVCRLASWRFREHRLLLLKRIIESQKKQSWWTRLLTWLRSLRKKFNNKIAAEL